MSRGRMRPSRRQFVEGVAGVSAALALGGRAASAQEPARMPRIGYVAYGAPPLLPPGATRNTEGFRQRLRELGYIEGDNVRLEYRFAEPVGEGFMAAAKELTALPVDVIVTSGSPAIRAAKEATSRIPIVMAVDDGDPVGTGLIASFARPGGNVTGVTRFSPGLNVKRLELLKDLLPGVARVAVLWNPSMPDKVLEFRETQRAARALGLQLQSVEMHDPDKFEAAVRAAREDTDALFFLGDIVLFRHRSQIVDLVAQSQLPAMYPVREYVDAGGLMAYGPNLADMYRRAAVHVDKIVKGIPPTELPVERPMRFELVLNLQTARTLGVGFPQALLQDASDAIQ